MEDYEYYYLKPDQLLRECLFGFDDEKNKKRKYKEEIRSDDKNEENDVKCPEISDPKKKKRKYPKEIIDLTNDDEEEVSECQSIPVNKAAPQNFTKIVLKPSKSNVSNADFKKRKKN